MRNMRWPRFVSYYLLRLRSDGSLKALSYIALGGTCLLFLYHLLLDQTSLASTVSWRISPQISTYDSDNWTDATHVSTLQSKNSAVVQVKQEKQAPTSVQIPIHMPSSSSKLSTIPKELVIAAVKKSDMTWVDDYVSTDWVVNVYRADVAKGEANFTVPENKGNEAMVYLTYLIDRYDSLPDIAVFLHGGRYQWHNDNPLYDSVISINDLQLDNVRDAGYVNLRCVWTIGCPAELQPARYLRERPNDWAHPTAMEYPHSYLSLFPGTKVPEIVGVQCCGQFAVSREAVMARGKEEYERMRNWLLESPLDAATSGRIFEYSWHILFGKTPQYCVDAMECYCKTYGYCNMSETDLENHWVFRGLTLPEGWPENQQQ